MEVIRVYCRVADAKNVVRLRHNDKGMITIVPQDEDRFSLNIDEAVQALRVADQLKKFQKQFRLLLKTLGEWLIERKQEWCDAFVALRDGGLTFVVIRHVPQYDAQFEDELSDLDIKISNDPALELVSIHSLALPPADNATVDTFLDSGCLLCCFWPGPIMPNELTHKSIPIFFSVAFASPTRAFSTMQKSSPGSF